MPAKVAKKPRLPSKTLRGPVMPFIAMKVERTPLTDGMAQWQRFTEPPVLVYSRCPPA
ncbi:hypothetical protein D3C83_250920 [compost metagenome]